MYDAIIVGARCGGSSTAMLLPRRGFKILPYRNPSQIQKGAVLVGAGTRNSLPFHDRGVVESCPGLYSIGLLFLYSLSSALVEGVGRDAEHIVDHIVSTRLAGSPHIASGARTAGRQYA